MQTDGRVGLWHYKHINSSYIMPEIVEVY